MSSLISRGVTGGKVGLITRALMGEGALEKAWNKNIGFIFYFLFLISKY